MTAERPSVSDLAIDRELDVSSVEGWVAVEELLEPEELASLPAGADPAERIAVAPDADAITLGHCCAICCGQVLEMPDCPCYTCDFIEGCTDA